VQPDIDAVWGAIRDAERPQIHIVLSVSDIHIQRKLGKSREQVLRIGEEAVAYARSLCDEVEYSPEDAGRADRDYLVETVEVVMLLQVRQAALGLECGIDATQIAPTSQMLTRLTGVGVQPNKAIVGANAFAHASGIHQDGVLKDALNYEIMRPDDVGLGTNR